MRLEDLATSAESGVHLSPREKDVLPLLLQGHTSKEIARALCVSPRTVDIYRSAILAKMRVRKTAQLHYALTKRHTLSVADRTGVAGA
ncbi:LuxR C-terminal-related transcriptional regulator [Fuscovulum blasticum]|uniref:LuxR C-terminal-related transcriptional regulator n=1 Tax=Fuscovulum blasticum TaxID=1075 RepID=UPI000D3E3CBA|nr:LuxR C-terminal-related transcriptional regulator [Fuscovulum blasticum]AWD23694.1 hypothetical protein B6K69_17855 [Fuscovulum blasticum]